MYRIEFDEEQLMVVATLEGYWSLETLEAYTAELFALMRRIRARHGFFRMLARSAAMTVQSSEVAAGFGTFTLELVQLCPGPIAITVGSMLNRIQASRALVHERIQVFVEEDEAIAWLMRFGPAASARSGAGSR